MFNCGQLHMLECIRIGGVKNLCSHDNYEDSVHCDFFYGLKIYRIRDSNSIQKTTEPTN